MPRTNARFPLDRNVIVRSKKVLAYCTKVCKNLRQKSRYWTVNLNPFRQDFFFSIVIDLFTITQNLLESHDFTIPLQSNGNQALVLTVSNYEIEIIGRHA